MHYIELQSEYEDLDKYENKYKDIIYYKKGTYIKHNQYGPAVIWADGSKFYYIQNKAHRLDGAAVIYLDGLEEYWINGKYLTKEEFKAHPERLKFVGKEHLICLT